MRYASLIAFIALLPTLALADPNPNQLGLCYLFEKDVMKKAIPCVIGSGNDDAGNFYSVLYNIAATPVRIEDNLGHAGPRRITLNGAEAETYARDTSGHEVDRKTAYRASPDQRASFLSCFRTHNSTTSYCFTRQAM